MTTLTLDPVVRLTRAQFYELCKVNEGVLPGFVLTLAEIWG